jgi:Fe-Mn family superoxide dismutase
MKLALLFALISTVWIKLISASVTGNQAPQFSLPPLPYPYSALEPVIDTETMMIHHDKHHATYLTNFQTALNQLADGYPHLAAYMNQPLLQIVRDANKFPHSFRPTIRNQGGGHYNHNLFWEILRPPSDDNKPAQASLVEKMIEQGWTDFATFQVSFNSMGAQLFGSGWTWVYAVCNSKTEEVENLLIENFPNQDVPPQGVPIMAIDLFEHAYYLKYKNLRASYLQNIWKVWNWDKINQKLIEACPGTLKKYQEQHP